VHLSKQCYCEGPHFYNGQGKDELRSMAKQSYNMRATNHNNRSFYNEVVLDGVIHEHLIVKNASAVVAAFIVPLNASCDKGCALAVFKMRDEVTQVYGSVQAIPVIGLDVTNGRKPFRILPSDVGPTPEHCEVGDAVECPTKGAMCEGDQCCPDGSTCPSAHQEFKCEKPKVNDCISPVIFA